MNKLELIQKIKTKKELSGLNNKIIRETLETYFKTKNIELKNLNKSDLKIIIKEIRKELRNLTGRFQKNSKKREKLLKQGKIKEILKTHKSTAERISFYPRLKKLITSLKIKSIIDIGCGINPIALASPKIKYYAFDINETDLKLINKFFKIKKILGKAFVYDLRKISSKKPQHSKADICLLFKIIDIVKYKTPNIIDKLVSSLDCKYFFISFSTRTLSGKPMNNPERKWVRKLLLSKNYKVRIFKTKNEIFYLAQK